MLLRRFGRGLAGRTGEGRSPRACAVCGRVPWGGGGQPARPRRVCVAAHEGFCCNAFGGCVEGFRCKTFGTGCGRYTGGAGGAHIFAPTGRGCAEAAFLCKTLGGDCGRYTGGGAACRGVVAFGCRHFGTAWGLYGGGACGVRACTVGCRFAVF